MLWREDKNESLNRRHRKIMKQKISNSESNTYNERIELR